MVMTIVKVMMVMTAMKLKKAGVDVVMMTTTTTAQTMMEFEGGQYGQLARLCRRAQANRRGQGG